MRFISAKILLTDQNYVDLHHVFPSRASGLQNAGYVIHGLPHLRREVADRELAGRIKPRRSGYKDELACLHRGGERHATNRFSKVLKRRLVGCFLPRAEASRSSERRAE